MDAVTSLDDADHKGTQCVSATQKFWQLIGRTVGREGLGFRQHVLPNGTSARYPERCPANSHESAWVICHPQMVTSTGIMPRLPLGLGV